MVPMNGYNRGDFYCFSYWFTIFDGLKTSANFVDSASTNNPMNSYNPGDIAIISAGAAEGKVGVAPVNRYNLADFQLLYCLIRGIPFATAFQTRPQPDRTTMTQQMFNDQLAAALEPVMTQQMFNDQLAAALEPKLFHSIANGTLTDNTTALIEVANGKWDACYLKLFSTPSVTSQALHVAMYNGDVSLFDNSISGAISTSVNKYNNSTIDLNNGLTIWGGSSGTSYASAPLIQSMKLISPTYADKIRIYLTNENFPSGTAYTLYGRDA